MADYAIGRTGGSLRDALNQLYPMTGLGEYNTMFPPQTGADQPGPPVPMPQPRPPGAPGFPQYAPMAGAALGAQAPGLFPRPAGAPPLNANLGIAGSLRSPAANGGVQFPIDAQTLLRIGGMFGPEGRGASLGVTRQF
jgi:hypothetical protein